MALLFMDSFDHYTTLTEKHSGANACSISAGVGRWGSSGVLAGSGNSTCYFYKTFADYKSTLIAAMAFKVDVYTPNSLLGFYDSGTLHCDLRFTAGGLLTFTRAGAVLSTGTTVIPLDAWQYVEVKATISDTGSYQVKLNGINEIHTLGGPVSGDTRNGANASTNQVRWGHTVGGNLSWSIDDVYVCDTSGSVSNDFLGDIRVEYLVPTGAGVRTGFTPSTGSNWSNVDETPASDTDYNSANTPGAMDLFQMANLSGNGLVHGVQTISRGKKDDAGFRKFKPAFYKASGLGDTNRWYTGTQDPVLDSYIFLPIQVMTTSPDTGVAWTVDEVNAIQYGYAVGDAGMFTIDAKVV